MSQCSLDSLENPSSSGAKVLTRLERGCGQRRDNLEVSREQGVVDPFVLHGAADKSDKDAEFNERMVTGVRIRYGYPEKSWRNAVIASSDVAAVHSRPTEEENAAETLGAKSRFRVGRNVAKKFDVPRRSTSSSSSSPMASEFRLRSSTRTRKSPNDVERFMKFDKKLGNAQAATVDKGKKPVSYLNLYRRKFASVERSRCTGTPEGSTSSICGDGPDERLANVENPASVSGDEQTELDFYRRVIEHGSRGSREARSCEDLDRSAVDEGVSTDDVSRRYSDSIQPVNPGRRVSYKSYGIEDYRSLSVPQLDRSLGPDRIAIESKTKWLMRRKSYGDTVSARNRQRILRRAQLKHSRRADAEKLPVSPLMDLQHPDSASKIVCTCEHSEKIVRTESPSRSRRRDNSKGAGVKERKLKTGTSRVGDLCENFSDDVEDSIHLRTLRQRHFDEKRRIDLLLKR